MIRPVKTYTKISTPFGYTPYPYNRFNRHLGTDYAGEEGRSVLAPVNGTVNLSYLSSEIGNCIEIKEAGNGRLHRFMHMKTRIPMVGQKVTEGQLIGTSGGAKGKPWSGTSSTGPHLHWDVRRAGVRYSQSKFSDYYDPEKLLKEEEMVTKLGLSVAYRMLLGTDTTDYGKKHYLGKVTFDEAYKSIAATSESQEYVKSLKAAMKRVDSNLPQAARQINA